MENSTELKQHLKKYWNFTLVLVLVKHKTMKTYDTDRFELKYLDCNLLVYLKTDPLLLRHVCTYIKRWKIMLCFITTLILMLNKIFACLSGAHKCKQCKYWFPQLIYKKWTTEITKPKIQHTWAQLFKANDVVSYGFIKIYIEWYANMLKFFAEKMWVAFAVQKLLTFFQQKISEYCVLNPLKQLTKWPLTSSLS